MTEKTHSKHHDDPAPSPTIAIGVIGAALVFIMVVGIQTLYYRAQNAEDRRKVIAVAPEELQQLRSEQQEQLNSYRWVSEKDGIAAIPIERAMEIAARRLNAERLAGSTSPARSAAPELDKP